jgi:2-polyprenyl-3-methyl-5-hydroxy-6-metoxy-1,4-benzoquinol methylase
VGRHFDPQQRELLDDSTTPAAELERGARDLAALNRHFGGHRLVRRFLKRWLNPSRCYRILDLCTGSADVPRAMVEWARQREITLRIDAMDANAAMLEIAKKRSSDFPEIHFVKGDALRDAPGEGYDLVHCALALHHFSDADATRLLARCAKLSNRWVLVSDLERHPLISAAISIATGILCAGDAAKRDGQLSARHAFSFREMRALAQAAGWQHFGHARCLFCRQAVWLDNRDMGDIPLVDAEVASLA